MGSAGTPDFPEINVSRRGERAVRAPRAGTAVGRALSGLFQLHEYKSSSHRIFRLNNIAKALKFLEDSNVSM